MKVTLVVLGARNLPLDKQATCYCKINYGGKSYKTTPAAMHATVPNVWVWNLSMHLKQKHDCLVITVWRTGNLLTSKSECFLGKLEIESLQTPTVESDQWYHLHEDPSMISKGSSHIPQNIRGSILLRIGPFVTQELEEAYNSFIDTTITNIMKNYNYKRTGGEFPKVNRTVPNRTELPRSRSEELKKQINNESKSQDKDNGDSEDEEGETNNADAIRALAWALSPSLPLPPDPNHPPPLTYPDNSVKEKNNKGENKNNNDSENNINNDKNNKENNENDENKENKDNKESNNETNNTTTSPYYAYTSRSTGSLPFSPLSPTVTYLSSATPTPSSIFTPAAGTDISSSTLPAPSSDSTTASYGVYTYSSTNTRTGNDLSSSSPSTLDPSSPSPSLSPSQIPVVTLTASQHYNLTPSISLTSSTSSEAMGSLRNSVESTSSEDSAVANYNFTAYNEALTEYGGLPPPDSDDAKDIYFNTYMQDQNKAEYEVRKLKGKNTGLSSAISSEYDLNERFQVLAQSISEFTEKTSFQTKRGTNEQLMHLYQDFVSRATTYGKIIITEVNFPVDKKTIKPVDVGGVAGGEKYIKSGILFKFALDINKIFGNDCNAAKVAGHELKGLISYYNCDVKGLCLPLMLLIDYKGFRLTASTLLPISHGTILYGSHDAGRTINDKDSVLTDKIRQVAQILNLKEHYCGMDGMSKLMYAPVDLEGHKGTDGRYYLVDFSRTLPPETPNPKFPVSYLYRLLRPEFLQSYNRPLSPDAFSVFSRAQPDFIQNNAELMYATNFLLKRVIPWSADEMLQAVAEVTDSNKDSTAFDLTQWVHRKGINIRHLGKLASHLYEIERTKKSKSSVHDCRLMCIIEMAARCIKQDLRLAMREEMRKSKELTDWPLRLVVVQVINALLNEDKIWDQLTARLELKFDIKMDSVAGDTLLHCIKYYNTAFCSDGKFFLVKRILKMIGVKIRKKSLQRWATRVTSDPMVEADLKELSEKIKHMNIIDHAQGYLFRMMSFSSDVNESTSYLERAIKRFNSALKSNPTNKYTLRNMAQAYYTTYRIETRKDTYDLPSLHLHPNLHLADRFYKDCLRADPHDIFSLDQYSSFLVVFHHYKEGMHWLLKLLQEDPQNHSALVITRHCLHAIGLKTQYQFKATHPSPTTGAADHEKRRSSSPVPFVSHAWRGKSQF